MATLILHPGDQLKFSLSNTDANGNFVDPTGVQLKYQVGTQPAVVKNYPADGIVRDGAGLYHFNYDTTGVVVTQRSLIQSEWIDTGAGASIGVDAAPPFIDPLPI